MDTELCNLKEKLNFLENQESVTQSQLEAENNHICLLAKMLYRKRKSIILQSSKLCIKRLKLSFKAVDKIDAIRLRDVCLEIKEQIESEIDFPKTLELMINFTKLSRTVARTFKKLNLLERSHETKQLIRNEIVVNI